MFYLYTPAYAVIDLKNVTMTIEDGAAASVELIFDEGNFTWTETNARIYVKNRGRLGSNSGGGTVKDDDETPMEVSFSGRYDLRSKGGANDVISLLQGYTGNRTFINGALNLNFTSTDADECAPYACDLVLTNVPSCGSSGSQTLRFPDFRVESKQFDVKAGTISISGKCNATEPIDE